ncbi:hypothetical protein CRM22_000531 [Opisthorchis felineus]|uniref:MARVEL domain-containing protein n=1 Tax=Opisthorchis felineus TaxID=147828 RepID=A0A4V3SH81_OPIFE|nr:hypothetical protein CRM22_000531 [Opisthorchis felineus]
MPKTTVANAEPEVKDRTLTQKIRCKLCDATEFEWDLFTLTVGLIFVLIGMCCCSIQLASIIRYNTLMCYGVGLWTSVGFAVAGILAIRLYFDDRVAPAAWMVASVTCDLLFGVCLSTVGCILSAFCIASSSVFAGITVSCVFGVIFGTFHAIMFIREIVKLRFQLAPAKSANLLGVPLGKRSNRSRTL